MSAGFLRAELGRARRGQRTCGDVTGRRTKSRGFSGAYTTTNGCELGNVLVVTSTWPPDKNWTLGLRSRFSYGNFPPTSRAAERSGSLTPQQPGNGCYRQDRCQEFQCSTGPPLMHPRCSLPDWKSIACVPPAHSVCAKPQLRPIASACADSSRGVWRQHECCL
jgi:hypothetical protein